MIVNEKETVVVRDHDRGSESDSAVAAVLIAIMVAVIIGYVLFASRPVPVAVPGPSTYVEKEHTTVQTQVPVAEPSPSHSSSAPPDASVPPVTLPEPNQ